MKNFANVNVINVLDQVDVLRFDVRTNRKSWGYSSRTELSNERLGSREAVLGEILLDTCQLRHGSKSPDMSLVGVSEATREGEYSVNTLSRMKLCNRFASVRNIAPACLRSKGMSTSVPSCVSEPIPEAQPSDFLSVSSSSPSYTRLSEPSPLQTNFKPLHFKWP